MNKKCTINTKMNKFKKLTTLLVLGSIFSVYAISGDNTNVNNNSSERYCAKMQNGKRVVMYMGGPITGNITLGDGTIIQPGGVVTRRNGISMIMKSGQCISKDGVLCEERFSEKTKRTK